MEDAPRSRGLTDAESAAAAVVPANIANDTDGDDDSSDVSAGFTEDGDDDDYFNADPVSVPTWHTLPPIGFPKMALIPPVLPPSEDTKITRRKAYDGLEIVSDTAVDYADPSIRLLQIRPGSFDQPIHCKLLKRRLWDVSRYIALSYSWGTEPHLSEIHLESRHRLATPFSVSAHLCNALRRLRDQQNVVNVWIDAISINQHDDTERAQQVNIMAQIFNQASEVRIWLGEHFHLGKMATSNDGLFWSLCGLPSPWWMRLWIVQECAYAQECPVVMLGGTSMSLEDLVRRWNDVAATANVERRDRLNIHLEFLRMPFEAWKTQKKDNKHRLPLLHRLQETEGRQYTDPHDRIYALLSLVEEREARQLQPDYRIPYSELLLDVAEVVGCHPPSYETRNGAMLKLCSDEPLVATIMSSDKKNARQYSEALHAAIKGGHHRIEHILLEQCTDPRKITDGTSVLRAAVHLNHAEVVKLLLKKRTIYKALAADFADEFQEASRWGHTDIVGLLLPSSTAAGISSAFEEASLWGYTDIVRLLLPSSTTAGTSSAFQEASFWGYTDIVRLLLPSSTAADISISLQAASCRGYTDIVQLLLPSVTAADTNSALQEASRGGFTDIVQLLSESSVRANVSQALHAASDQGHAAVAPDAYACGC